MDKLIAVLVICGLVIVLYLGVIQDNLAPSIVNKGNEIENVIDPKN